MNLFGWARNAYRAAQRALTYEQFTGLGLLAPPVAAGVSVTQETALSVSGYWNALNVIAGDIGMIDRHLYKRSSEDDDRERAVGHPVYKVVHDAPNEYMTPATFWQTITSHALSWGNGYAEIEFDNAMRPIALWPIMPNQLEPVVEGTPPRLAYRYAPTGKLIAPEDILHIPGLGFDGIKGYSVVTLARQSLGLAIAAEVYGGAFYGNGAWPGMALEHPGTLTQPAQDRLRTSINTMHQGADRAHKILILEEGMKASRPIAIPPNDAQFIESRQMQVEELCRWLNLPPHKLKLKVGERPGGNFEASQIDYLTGTLLPWATRIEQECNRKLISKAQRGTFYVEHLYTKLLRADIGTRTRAYKTFFDLGVMDAEQIARLENLPRPKPKPAPAPAAPPPPPKAEEPLPPPPQKEPEPPPARSYTGSDEELRLLLVDQIGRYVRREIGRLEQAAKKDVRAFGAAVETFYAREAPQLAAVLELPVRLRLSMLGLAADDISSVVQTLTGRYLARSKDEVLALPAKDLAYAVEQLARRWETTRAQELAAEIMAIGVPEENENAA